MRLEGRVALVTGGGRNVGQAIARRFAREGANVAVVDLHEGRGAATVEELNAERSGSARFVQCDVSSSDDVQRMVEEVVEAFGGIDILVNNVAITDRGRTVLELDEELWHRVLGVTLDKVGSPVGEDVEARRPRADQPAGSRGGPGRHRQRRVLRRLRRGRLRHRQRRPRRRRRTVWRRGGLSHTSVGQGEGAISYR